MWIRALRERGTSGHSTVNVLWKDDVRPLYLMDNHRAAFWCWAQHVAPEDRYGLIHVDWHWDGAWVPVDDSTLRVLRVADFETFDARHLPARPTEQSVAVVCWDNYIDAFLRVCPKMTEAHLTVHQDRVNYLKGKLEAAVNDGRAQVHASADLHGDLDSALKNAKVPLIVNVDLDYFFTGKSKSCDLDFVRSTFAQLATHWDRTTCMTIALSPECCCGEWDARRLDWKPAEDACRAAFEGLGVPYPLPPSGGRVPRDGE